MKQYEWDKFQEQIGIDFHDSQLLKQAFTHSSYVNEHRTNSIADNERLEFLGDAVLELAVSKYLFTHFPEMSEGEMTKLRASIVCEASLVQLANQLQFSQLIYLGKGEEITGGRNRPALLADVFEAFIGAMYLDQGLESVYDFLSRYVFPKISGGDYVRVMDYKSILQESVQQDNLGKIEYEIVQERGPAHDREFIAEVYIDGHPYGQGAGRSKKEAEQLAAQKALHILNNM